MKQAMKEKVTNLVLLIFKSPVFKSGEKKYPYFRQFPISYKKIQNKLQKTIFSDNQNRTLLYTKKLCKTNSNKTRDRMPKNIKLQCVIKL